MIGLKSPFCRLFGMKVSFKKDVAGIVSFWKMKQRREGLIYWEECHSSTCHRQVINITHTLTFRDKKKNLSFTNEERGNHSNLLQEILKVQ